MHLASIRLCEETKTRHLVTIQNLHTVAPCYGELLALLVHLTWLLHVGPGFETCHVPLSFGKIYHSLRGTLQYVAAPLLVPARGSSCWWLLDRVWAALISTHMYDIFSTYTRVTGSVTIQKLCTVAPRYGELLALLVYLTWLLHVGSGFETCLVPLSFGKIYHSLRGTLQYVAAPLLVPARGSSCWWLLDRV